MHASSYMYQKQHPGQLRGHGFRLADTNTHQTHTSPLSTAHDLQNVIQISTRRRNDSSERDAEGAVPFTAWSASPAAPSNYANPAAAAPTC